MSARKSVKKRHHAQNTGKAKPPSQEHFATIRNAALIGKAEFPDQIDYYDPETGNIE